MDRDYWYVLAPNVFRLGHEETIVAGVLGDARNRQFEVWSTGLCFYYKHKNE